MSAIEDVITSKEVVIELFEGDSTCHGLLISRDTTIYFSFQLNEIYLSALSTYQHIIRGDELLLPLDLQLKNYINCTQSISEPFVELLLNNEIFNDVKSLTIIPDGVFTFLPFEALITANDRSIIDFKLVPYFLKKWDITYHISGKMLLESRSSIPSNHKVNIKAVGPSEDAILFSAIEEIKHIKRRFGNKCLAVLDNQRNVILNDQSNDKILHLASHAVIDTNNYNLSFLHFGDEKNDSLKIYDYEISNHKFQNALVVLNACETFQGKVYKGEGVYNLSQSFLIGGASSVISTLWKIEDQSAAKLMTLFYENIKKGEAYEASLNLAKRSMLNEQVHAHPFFWASYLFNGESQTNFKKEKTVNRLVLLLAVSISLISLMYVINRKSKQA
ncbi:MAG: CHAT domain-containing protein [Chitinophagales bacterium]